VADVRTTMVLAELGRHVPVVPRRPPVEVEALAQRPLGRLHAELAQLSSRSDDATRRGAAVRAAQRELDRAEQALGDLGAPAAPPRRRRSRPGGAEVAGAAARGRAEQRIVGARRRLALATQSAADVAEAPSRRVWLLSQAIGVREARLRAGVLGDAPDWVRHDIRRRLAAHGVPGPALVHGLARAYGDVAVYADRWGLDADAPTLDQVIGQAPPPGATQDWLELASRLASPAVVAERGIDVSR
jgi:hypothetical protein